jgi:endoglycosylceramidase
MRCTLLVALLCGCSPAPYVAKHSPIDTDGAQLRDQEGRARIFRGLNVHIAGIFDVTFSDGRPPREPLPGFDASDAAEMRAYGFNLVRLPINWSAVEPEKDQFSSDYLDRVAGIVDLLRAQNILVLIDLHEDGFSKEICEDGAPLWAIVPPPPMLTTNPLMGPDCHIAAAAQAAFVSFFADKDGLQESYAAMLQHVATRFKNDSDVIGYEIMNEPIGQDSDVQAFSIKMAQAIRSVDTKKLIVFEPSAARNFINASPLGSAKFPVDGTAYAVHIYTGVFTEPTALQNGMITPELQISIAGARAEADSWGTPLIITEYGLGSQTTNGPLWISAVLDNMDATFASSTWWLWRAPDVGGWGLFDPQPDGTYVVRPTMMDALSRPYARAIGGDPQSVKWDGTRLSVSFTGRGGVPTRHEVFWSRGTPDISCDHKSVSAAAVDSVGHIYTVDCGGGGQHVLELADQGKS